jgi:hypothetical protein
MGVYSDLEADKNKCQYPASDKQLAKLYEFGVYRTELTKGEASDLLGQLFAEQRLCIMI